MEIVEAFKRREITRAWSNTHDWISHAVKICWKHTALHQYLRKTEQHFTCRKLIYSEQKRKKNRTQHHTLKISVWSHSLLLSQWLSFADDFSYVRKTTKHIHRHATHDGPKCSLSRSLSLPTLEHTDTDGYSNMASSTLLVPKRHTTLSVFWFRVKVTT